MMAVQTRFDDFQSIPIEVPDLTSRQTKAAAHRSLTRVGPMQQAILSLLTQGPRTDRQMADAIGCERTSINGRRAELIAAGCVEQAGTTVDQRSGKTVALWRLVVR